MTTTEIFTILKTWINTILNVEEDYSIPIIRGEQSAPKPAKEYIVIHQPMSLREYATGNESKGRKVIDGDIIHGYIDYTRHWQATISIEEVGFEDNGDKLRSLINSLNRQDIKSYFRNSKISILRNEGITPIPSLSDNIWELRTDIDLIILFPDEGTYEPGIIESVEITTNYEDIWEDGELDI